MRKFVGITLALLVFSCSDKNRDLNTFFSQVKKTMDKKSLTKFKETEVDSLNFYTANFLPDYSKVFVEDSAMLIKINQYLDLKNISNNEEVRYIYVTYLFHTYLNKSDITDEELLVKTFSTKKNLNYMRSH